MLDKNTLPHTTVILYLLAEKKIVTNTINLVLFSIINFKVIKFINSKKFIISNSVI